MNKIIINSLVTLSIFLTTQANAVVIVTPPPQNNSVPPARNANYGGTDWASIGYLSCPQEMASQTGCGEDVSKHWYSPFKAGKFVPWVKWLEKYKGPKARVISLSLEYDSDGNISRTLLFYGVPK